MTVPLIELDEVAFTYPGVVPVAALASTNLCIEAGERVAIVGPSGSGKSTLLQVLGLLARPTSGVYRLDGYDVGALSESQRCDVRGTRIGFVFQAFHLMAHRDVASNVELPLRYSPSARSDAERAAMVAEALASVGLSHRAHHRCNELSGGECQRVAIARAMVGRPSIVLADEPTGNLDTANSAQIIDHLLAAGSDQASTLIVITHDPDVAERFERRLVIRDGNVTDTTAPPQPMTAGTA